MTFSLKKLFQDFGNIIFTVLFCLIFIECYIQYLNFYFDYSGFTLFPRPLLFKVLTLTLAVVPILFYRGFRQISSFLSVFIYLILYIPTIITFGYGSELDLSEVFFVQFIFLLMMIMLMLADRMVLGNLPMIKIRANLFSIVYGLTVFGALYMAFKYRSNLRFVSFTAEVYELRSENLELGQDFFTRYFSMWLSGVLIPICLAYGLVAKRWVYFLTGTAACVIFYMATASKGIVLFPVIFVIIYFLFSKNRLNKIYSYLVLSLTVVLWFLLLVTTLDSVWFIVSSLVMSRTIGNGGMLTMWYYDFFQTHPWTYYSHINLFNAFTHSYPYGDLILGQVVGKEYWADDMNANANFWATDGIAAMGLYGVAISSFVLFLIFVILNTFTRNYNKMFIALVFIPFIFSLLNTSLFSTLWSGGGFFLILFFSFRNTREEVFRAQTT